MRCERLILFLILFNACGGETPSATDTNASTTTTTQPPVVATAPAAPVPAITNRNYDDALNWFRSAPSFRFMLDDADIHAEGKMTRKAVGAESIEAKVNNEEWRASAGALGVVWERRNGGAWSKAEPPAFGNRVFQRVTLAIDPQKKEGAAQLARTEGGVEQYRFTNANSGEVHEVWIDTNAKRVERMKIGTTVDLKITP